VGPKGVDRKISRIWRGGGRLLSSNHSWVLQGNSERKRYLSSGVPKADRPLGYLAAPMLPQGGGGLRTHRDLEERCAKEIAEWGSPSGKKRLRGAWRPR